MTLFLLPDMVVYRICDFMNIEDLLRLREFDWRIDNHVNMKERCVNVIKKKWKRVITRGRDYAMDIKELKRFCSLHSKDSLSRMSAQLTYINESPLSIKFHTPYPRHRIIIPKHKFREIVCERIYSLLCEFTLIPPADLYLRSASTGKRYKVTNESVIPICTMPLESLYIEHKPETRYICYTGVILPFTFQFNHFFNGPMECINMNAYISCGFIYPTKKMFVRKNPGLIPMQITNED